MASGAATRVGTLCLISLSGTLMGQSGQPSFAKYQARVAADLRNQPHWATPLITVNPRAEQGFRADFVHQTTPDGRSAWNYGNAKGLQLVPYKRVEIRLSPPPFFMHSDSRSEDGFGDVAFRLKYRVYGSPEERHNAIVSLEFGASVPTGKGGNGSCCAVLSPTLELGKGLGKIALVTSAGGSLPVTNSTGVGRQIALNNAVLYHAAHFLWLQTEFNSTLFHGGKNDGRSQVFVTPGVIVSRIPLTHPKQNDPEALLLTLGAGEQIAITRNSTYNHSPVFTFRVRF